MYALIIGLGSIGSKVAYTQTPYGLRLKRSWGGDWSGYRRTRVGVDIRWVRFTGLIKETGVGPAELGDRRSLVLVGPSLAALGQVKGGWVG